MLPWKAILGNFGRLLGCRLAAGAHSERGNSSRKWQPKVGNLCALHHVLHYFQTRVLAAGPRLTADRSSQQAFRRMRPSETMANEGEAGRADSLKSKEKDRMSEAERPKQRGRMQNGGQK